MLMLCSCCAHVVLMLVHDSTGGSKPFELLLTMLLVLSSSQLWHCIKGLREQSSLTSNHPQTLSVFAHGATLASSNGPMFER